MTAMPAKVGVGVCSFMLYLYRMCMKRYRLHSMLQIIGMKAANVYGGLVFPTIQYAHTPIEMSINVMERLDWKAIIQGSSFKVTLEQTVKFY